MRKRRALPPSACCAWRAQAGRRVHVLHVTTADELPLLAAARDLATVETTPQHLTLAAPECYERLGSYAQMNPPIREAHHREALWEAVSEGLIDVIGSDHAPHARAEKDKTYPDTPSGMPGVQTLVTILLDHVNAGRLSAGALCRSDQRRRGADFRHRRQRAHRARLRCGFHHRRSEGEKENREFLDRLQMRLDAVRRHGDHRLGAGDDHSRKNSDARPRPHGGRTRDAAPLR